jgi:hypothetical protein
MFLGLRHPAAQKLLFSARELLMTSVASCNPTRFLGFISRNLPQINLSSMEGRIVQSLE